jgi:hypothetical protein
MRRESAEFNSRSVRVALRGKLRLFQSVGRSRFASAPIYGRRIGRLVVRLEYGIPGDVVDIARYAGRELGRGDYRRLAAGGLTNVSSIDAAPDNVVLEQLDRDRTKLRVVREYADGARAKSEEPSAPLPTLKPYQS